MAGSQGENSLTAFGMLILEYRYFDSSMGTFMKPGCQEDILEKSKRGAECCNWETISEQKSHS